MTQSTSPLVLIYASIDLARMQMATAGQELWSRARRPGRARPRRDRRRSTGVRCLGHDVLEREGVYAFDPTRLTISACGLGLSRLRARGPPARRLRDRDRGRRRRSTWCSTSPSATRTTTSTGWSRRCATCRAASAAAPQAPPPRRPAAPCSSTCRIHRAGDEPPRRLLLRLRAAAGAATASAASAPRSSRPTRPASPSWLPARSSPPSSPTTSRRAPRRASTCTDPKTPRCAPCGSSASHERRRRGAACVTVVTRPRGARGHPRPSSPCLRLQSRASRREATTRSHLPQRGLRLCDRRRRPLRGVATGRRRRPGRLRRHVRRQGRHPRPATGTSTP